jgi:Cu/Ag efflux protein CusF
MSRTLMLAALLSLALPVFGQSTPPPQAAAEALADGEIRRIDKAQSKVTIRHGPIANLDMPPMTMVFQARDAALLDRIAVGDKVRFRAEKDGSAYVVTRVEKAP